MLGQQKGSQPKEITFSTHKPAMHSEGKLQPVLNFNRPVAKSSVIPGAHI